ncbi:MAG: cobalamin biosynthesis protein CbiD [Firmicutes bacterium]|nr:cobalamin biosynthesis protein CbiD [Bacillota bacterium]MBQ2305506.1 cobalamin biosynthesis protein CbiD [Bacillota bacterium]
MDKDYAVVGGKKLKQGYTTGSCAAAAAAASCQMMLTGVIPPSVSFVLPSGETAEMEVFDPKPGETCASCSVVKDGGDDPDVTTGLKIFAEVSKSDHAFSSLDERVTIEGGQGVGRVTEEGLQIPVGEAAINPVPRRMIRENVTRVADQLGYHGALRVVISVPGGEEVAKKTFNSRLGILGGISIIGTTGIVEPMSQKALVETIKTFVDKYRVKDPETILITPGNYGADFIREYLGIDLERAVQISNFVGESLDYIRYRGFKRILFIGHTGKLIKTAAGVMNTHSSYADCRMEIIAALSAARGADSDKVRAILKCVTTDKAFDILKGEEYFEQVKKDIVDRAMFHLRSRAGDGIQVETVMFTTDRTHIMMSDGAEDLIAYFK